MEIADNTAEDDGRYMKGEYHTHTGQSKDATSTYMSLENVLGAAFRNEAVIGEADPAAKLSALTDDGEFDFLGLADHLRQSYNGVDTELTDRATESTTLRSMSLFRPRSGRLRN